MHSLRLTFLFSGCFVALSVSVAIAQGPPPYGPPPGYYPPPPPPPDNNAPPSDYASLPPPPDPGAVLPPLDQLLAPIALYPDPLISLILPAATFPSQVQDAAGFLQGGGDPSQVGNMGWDSSVQGLAHYSDVLAWMNANFDWTQQLGGAFASQPAAVMDAIQDLRRKAQAAGTLVDTPQQQVIVEDDTVSILPGQPNVIYVPQYDPAVVYVMQPPGLYPRSYFAWSQPYPAGAWLSFDFDWRTHAVYQGDWYDYRMQHGGWARPINYAQVQINVTAYGGAPMNHGYPNGRGYAAWHPPHNAPPPPPQLGQRGSGLTVSASVQARFAQPHVMSGTPPPPPGAARANALVVTRGERPPPAQANARPAPMRPAAPTSRPATPSGPSRAPQPQATHQAQGSSPQTRIEQQQAPERAREGANVRAEQQAPANPPRPAQASQERIPEHAASEANRPAANGPASHPPAPAAQKAPAPKKPAPKTKEEPDKEREQQPRSAQQQ
jgi:hypothetical protein